jgi:two-component system KDP operon response regulator KdpE
MMLPRYRCRGFGLRRRPGCSNGHHEPDQEWSAQNRHPEGAPPSLNSDSKLLDCPALSKILLIEHDSEIRGLVRFGLEKQGFHVLEASTGSEGIEIALRDQADAVLLDMGVTDVDGLEVIERVRGESRIPILALSGRAGSSSAIKALDRGANDYIARPFSVEELAARLRAAQRCLPPPAPKIFHSGSFSLDLMRRTVTVGNSVVNLSATEYSLLQLFVRHAGLVITHTQILRAVWGSDMLDKVNYLRVYMLALRRKLACPSEPDLFVTERGVGYRLVVREPSSEGRELEPN